MRLSASTPKTEILQRRERWRRDHAAALTLGSAFPTVQRLCIDLSFTDTAGFAPVPQSHVLHPAAKAFFDFLCPYADCDGHFNLDSVVERLLAGRADRLQGTLACTGTRLHGREGRHDCLLRLDYTIGVEYRQNEAPGRA